MYNGLKTLATIALIWLVLVSPASALNQAVGNWSFGEGAGTNASDKSGFGNHGTTYGTSWTTVSVNGAVNGSALYFNEAPANVTIPSSSSLIPGNNSFSIVAWVKLGKNSDNSGNRQIVIRKGAATDEYSIIFEEQNTPYFCWGDGVTEVCNVHGSPVTLNTWTLLTVVRNRGTSTASLYQNGILIGTSQDSVGAITNTNTLFIGAYSGGSFLFNGTIDEVSMYNYALNQSEITTIYQQFQPVPAYPVGGLNIIGSPSSINFTWHDTQYPSDQLLVASDSGFINLLYDSIVTSDYAVMSLSTGTYYWTVRQYNQTTATYGATSANQTFSISATAPVAGRLNITVFDEQNYNRILTFTADLYNSTSHLSKTASSGWANFSSAEVSNSEYLVRIIPNSSYAARDVLVTSPNNLSVYIPATSGNTIDTISFYLLDYTGRFPWTSSYITVTKNSTVMHSSYFDSDAKVAANLIRGDQYTITVYNNNAVQQWGNYASTASGNVEVVIMNIGANTTQFDPLTFNITNSNNDITLNWNDKTGILTAVNFTVYKGASRILVYSLQTAVRYGSASYIVTNTSDIYYAYVTITTTSGTQQGSKIIEYRSGTQRTDQGRGYVWTYNSFSMPAWVYSAFCIVALMMLAGSFGSLHRGEGAIITSLMAVFFWSKGWLTTVSAGAGFIGALALFAVLYHLESKRRQQGVF